jgi:hypothetical protein
MAFYQKWTINIKMMKRGRRGGVEECRLTSENEFYSEHNAPAAAATTTSTPREREREEKSDYRSAREREGAPLHDVY